MWALGEDVTVEKVAPRANSPMAFDPRKNRVVMFGGFNGLWLSDVLVLDISSSKNSKDMLEEYQLSSKEGETLTRKLQASVSDPERDPPQVASSVLTSVLFTGEHRIFKLNIDESEASHFAEAAALFSDDFDAKTAEPAVSLEKVRAH